MCAPVSSANAAERATSIVSPISRRPHIASRDATRGFCSMRVRSSSSSTYSARSTSRSDATRSARAGGARRRARRRSRRGIESRRRRPVARARRQLRAVPAGVRSQQVLLLSVLRLTGRLHRSRHRPQADPALPATHQREDRTVPPLADGCTYARFYLRDRTPRRATRLDPLLQSPPAPLRDRSRTQTQCRPYDRSGVWGTPE